MNSWSYFAIVVTWGLVQRHFHIVYLELLMGPDDQKLALPTTQALQLFPVQAKPGGGGILSVTLYAYGRDVFIKHGGDRRVMSMPNQ